MRMACSLLELCRVPRNCALAHQLRPQWIATLIAVIVVAVVVLTTAIAPIAIVIVNTVRLLKLQTSVVGSVLIGKGLQETVPSESRRACLLMSPQTAFYRVCATAGITCMLFR